MESVYLPFFNPEAYHDFASVDIVHIESVEKTAGGKKRVEIETKHKAAIVLANIQALQRAGVIVRLIDNPSKFEPPKGYNNHSEIRVGGAFVGQCQRDYISAGKGFNLVMDPLISVELD